MADLILLNIQHNILNGVKNLARIWNLPCRELDRQHLLGEHSELHMLWGSITLGRRGWANHPETKRWRGRLKALYKRHEEQVAEMLARGYNHNSPLDTALIPPEDSEEWPPISDADIARDRADLAAHFPGWRKALAAQQQSAELQVEVNESKQTAEKEAAISEQIANAELNQAEV